MADPKTPAKFARSFRISGNPMIMQLFGPARANVEPYFRRRSVPWKIGSQTVFYWLTRAELMRIDPSFKDADAKKLCRTIKGPKEAATNEREYEGTYDSMIGYVDLPKKGGSINPLEHFYKPYMWADVIGNSKVLNARLATMIGAINAEDWIPPDEDCSISDDKRNLRGIQYVGFLAYRPETLYLSGTTTPVAAFPTLKEREDAKALFYNSTSYFYTKKATTIKEIMSASKIYDY